MVGSLRMPASGGTKNGRRQLLAAMSGKKSTPARNLNGAPLAPRRLAPVEATYSSPKKRKRAGDMEDLLGTEDIPSRPQQKARTTVWHSHLDRQRCPTSPCCGTSLSP
ncbi:hypothetical protein Ndes2526A_g05442 [Nannochloris sp. 'desiccata']